MKNLLFAFSILFIVYNVNAQCIADAGIDKHSCPDDVDANEVPIGGNPTASNGIAPYNYSWSIKPIEFGSGTGIFLHASDILDDTTIANPKIIYRTAADSIMFYLTITDDSNCSNTDSCKVSFTNFGEHLIYHDYYIAPGDSVYLNNLPNVGGGMSPLSYDWNPSHGLSDTTLAAGFWAKPDSSISYTLTVTDSKECEKTATGPLYFVHVVVVGVEYLKKDAVKVFPNPVNNFLYIEVDVGSQIKDIKLYNVQTQEVFHRTNTEKWMDLSDLSNGIYIVEIELDEETIRQKIVKK